MRRGVWWDNMNYACRNYGYGGWFAHEVEQKQCGWYQLGLDGLKFLAVLWNKLVRSRAVIC